MEAILKQLIDGQAKILNHLAVIDGRLNKQEDRFDKLEARFDKLEARFDKLENKVADISGQLDENTQFIKALIHRTDELDAKFEGLLLATATKQSIVELNGKFDLLNDRLFQTETKVHLLSKAK